MRALVTAALFTGISALSLAQEPAPPNNDALAITTALGPLAENLVAAFSMDLAPNGSMVFSRPPASGQATFSFTKQFVKDEGRQCTNFAEKGAFLMVYSVKLGSKYTLATWAKLPFAGSDAVVWDGAQDAPLYVQNGQYMCSEKGGAHALGAYDKALTGWHHLAVTCDGNTTSLYVDGVINGTAPVATDVLVRQIGGRNDPATGTAHQCGLLDDMFMFDRPLTAVELTKLAPVQLPTHNPGASSIASLAPPAPSIPAPTSEASTEATELVKTYSNSLVFVSGGNGAGSGFIANLGGKPFLITNAHVAAGVRGASFRTLQGSPVTVGTASVAVAHDIFAMQAQSANAPFAVMRDVGENTAIGDEVVVLGNAEGGGVINTIMGRIVGVGPDLVEVDAPFQPGNSGSPIIHLKSKKVIGVATYLSIRKYDTATKAPIKEPIIRRFGYRVDSVKTWQPVDWRVFFAQATEMESVEQLTKDLIVFIQDIADDSRVSRGKHTNPAIRNRIDAWLGTKTKQMSARDASTVDQNFISFLKIASQTDVTAARQHLTYDYFQRQLVDQQNERTEIARIFGKIIESVRQER